MDMVMEVKMEVKMVFHITVEDMERKKGKILDNMTIPKIIIIITINLETTIQTILAMETIWLILINQSLRIKMSLLQSPLKIIIKIINTEQITFQALLQINLQIHKILKHIPAIIYQSTNLPI